MAKAQYMATIPIVAASDPVDGQPPIEPDPEAAGHHHEEPHVAPPRVAWTVSISREDKRRLMQLVTDGPLGLWVPPDKWDGMGGEVATRRHVRTQIAKGRFEFKITKIEPVNPCSTQLKNPNPFKQEVGDKDRPNHVPWYRKVLFDPIPEAFPGEDCLDSDCIDHEYKATAKVRLVGSHAWQHEGFDIDPHVIFHGDGEPDDPQP